MSNEFHCLLANNQLCHNLYTGYHNSYKCYSSSICHSSTLSSSGSIQDSAVWIVHQSIENLLFIFFVKSSLCCFFPHVTALFSILWTVTVWAKCQVAIRCTEGDFLWCLIWNNGTVKHALCFCWGQAKTTDQFWGKIFTYKCTLIIHRIELISIIIQYCSKINTAQICQN